MEPIVLGIYLWFKIYFLIDTNTKMWTEITDLVVFRKKLLKFLQGAQVYSPPEVAFFNIFFVSSSLCKPFLTTIPTLCNDLKTRIQALSCLWEREGGGVSPTHSKEPSVACVPSCLVFRTFCLIVKQGKWFMIDFNTFQDKNSPNLKKINSLVVYNTRDSELYSRTKLTLWKNALRNAWLFIVQALEV